MLLIALSLIWGSSFILMKRGLEAFSSDVVAALRISIAFVILSPLLIVHHKINLRKYFWGLIWMGVLGNLIPAFLFTASETQISSSLAGMLNALTPLFTVLVGFIWLKNSPSRKQVFGIVLGFVSASALMYFSDGSDKFKNLAYASLVVVATVCYALSINGIKKFLTELNAVTATVWAFCFTGPIALVYLFGFTDFVQVMNTHPKALYSLGFTGILAIVGTAFSVVLYNILIRNAGAVFASSCTYLIPIVAVMWGILEGEKIHVIQIISVALVIASVYWINRD